MKPGAYENGLDHCKANYLPLTPLGFLDRAALVHPDRIAVVHGDVGAEAKLNQLPIYHCPTLFFANHCLCWFCADWWWGSLVSVRGSIRHRRLH